MKKTTFKSYEVACKFLKRNPKNMPIVNKLEEKYKKRQIADFKLEILAEATNKKNGFTPDYEDSNKEKWFPVLIHNGKKGKLAAFRFYCADYFWTAADSTGGSRLVFSSSEEAKSFCENNLKLYNDKLL